MAINESTGPFTFGIESCIIAAWVGDGTYGTAVRLPGVKSLTAETEWTSGEQDGDDHLMSVAAKIRAGNVTLSNARISYSVLNVLLQQPIESSSSHRAIKVTSRKTRYIGLVARIDEPEGDGDVHFFIPKLKVMGGLNFTFTFGEYTTPELTLKALLDDNWADEDDYPCVVYPIWHEDRETLVIPPLLAELGS